MAEKKWSPEQISKVLAAAKTSTEKTFPKVKVNPADKNKIFVSEGWKQAADSWVEPSTYFLTSSSTNWQILPFDSDRNQEFRDKLIEAIGEISRTDSNYELNKPLWKKILHTIQTTKTER